MSSKQNASSPGAEMLRIERNKRRLREQWCVVVAVRLENNNRIHFYLYFKQCKELRLLASMEMCAWAGRGQWCSKKMHLAG